jgi:hypothetical protein
MLKRLYPPLRPQSVGEVLDTGFQIFAASLIKTLPYGIVMILAGQLGNIYNLASGRPLGRFTPRDLPSSIVYVVSLVALSALFMAMMLRQRAIAQGEPTSMRAELLRALGQVPAQLAMFLLTSLVVILGLFLLVLPGLYIAVALSMAYPALVLERQGPFEALAYSRRLVRGNWWRTTAILLVTIVMLAVFYFLVVVLAAIAVQFARGADLVLVSAASTVLVIALGAFSTPFLTAMTLAQFGNLRVRHATVAAGN